MQLSTEISGILHFGIVTSIYLGFLSVISGSSSFYAKLLLDRSQSTSFFAPLNGLRGVLAIAVVIHHAVLLYELYRTGLWDGPDVVSTHSHFLSGAGAAAVRMFFFLSGFLFWQKSLSAINHPSPVNFWRARARRLAPAYAVVVLADVVLTFLKSPNGTVPNLQTTAAHIGQWIFFNRPMPHQHDAGCFFYEAGTLLGPAWSLIHESGFYLLVPLLAFFSTKIRSIILIVVLLSIATILQWYIFPYLGSSSFLIGNFLVYLGFSFGGGIAAATAFHYLQKSAVVSGLRKAGWLSVLCLGASPYLHFSLPLQSLVIFIGMLPIAFGNSLFGILTSRGAQISGEISYGVYLFHSAFLIFGLKIFGAELPMSILTGPIGLIVLAFSLLVFRYLEFPINCPRWV